MVATTFSADTPNLVTDIVRRNGVAGNWVWWAFVLTGVATVFFYARLWRRSGVLTDLEFYELRYSGTAASAVRGFRAVYLGLFFNCMIMAAVNLAACKIAGILFGLPRWQTLLLVGVLNVDVCGVRRAVGRARHRHDPVLHQDDGGDRGGVFRASPRRRSAACMRWSTKVSAMHGPGGINYLGLLPDFTNNWDLAVAVFIMPIAVQWWAVWYPGAEPGGGSYIAQRMLASKSEKDALGAVLFFNIAHYVLRPWPWILVALCSLIVYPELSDIQRAFPNLEPRLLGHDIAYPAMLTFLPPGFLGLMVGGLIAANSSTILTHLNWGASYLVHDFYRRFVRTGRRRAPLRARRPRSRPSGSSSARAASVYLLDTAQGRVRRDPAGRRRHRLAVSPALVLVARECVVRDRRDGQFVSRVDRASRAASAGHRVQHARRAGRDRRDHDGVLGCNRVRRPADRPRRARRVLPQGSARGPGLGADSANCWRRAAEARRRSATTFRWRCSAGSPAAHASGRRCLRKETSSTAACRRH